MDLGSAIMLFSSLLVTFFVVIKLIFKWQSKREAPSSPESSSSQHDVFPSYHREDVRSSCLNRILKEFKEKGINPFIDYETERSRSEVIKAIRGSRIAVVMLSRDYASSPRCLNELVEIIKCKNELGQKVVTIFCELDPADVTKQTGDFGEMFRETCVGKTKEETWRWGQALAEVATTVTYHSRDWDDEADMVKSLSTYISNILCISSPPLSDFQGLDSAEGEPNTVEEITSDVPYKKHLYSRDRALEGKSNKLLHTVHIYCADTLQYSFASHLSMDFQRKGLNAFVNCNEALDVIEEASASVVVFSKNYLSSVSCLDKLERILQCHLVVPVFYGISPSDMVVQENESVDRISEWNSALEEVRELPGHHSREKCSECELVEEIVNDVSDNLCPMEQIGINSRMLEIEQLLCKQPWGIRRIGIWGMPGTGKTTLAKAVFDQISGGYEASCFIKHFDKAFHEKGDHRLLEEHFGEVLKELPRVCSITRPSTPQDISSKKRILVVLDDVHDPLIAESFLGGFHCFGPGSLIIITSRDKNVFLHCKVNHVYEVQSLNENESLQLFSQYAFGKCIKEENLLKLSMEVVEYANGNPLALSFYGRELKGKKLSEMETTFLKLKLRTPYKIYDLFKSSYESLDERDKNIFLDIACFFNGKNVKYVKQLLEGCGLFPHVGIDVLVEKCLVTISENKVKMHRIIQDFGREIINRETIHINRRRRLWEPWTIKFLLEDNELEASGYPKATFKHALGTEDIEGIFLDISNLLFDVKPTAFETMLNLRFLKIHCSSYRGLCLPKGLESLPYELRLLHWEYYPLQSLPQIFDPCHLVELNMPNSQLQNLWEGTKNLRTLKIVKLCHSQHLTEIDNLCKAPNIELIDLRGCTKLQSFPATDHLQHLRVVNLSGCREITSFPEVSPNIEELHLQRTGIRELPVSIGNATNLEILVLGDCYLMELPSSFRNLRNLKELDLSGCSKLEELPSSFGNLRNLKELDLNGCSKLEELPYSFGNLRNLKELDLTRCSNLEELPLSFGNATNLEILDLTDCSSLRELPSSFGNITNLKMLYLRGCSNLEELPASIGNATNLEVLEIGFCTSLTKLTSSIGNFTNLKELDLSGLSILKELPFSFENASYLELLDLSDCSSLEKLPSSFGDITNLKRLYLEGCSSLVELPASIGNATNLEILDLSNCSKLKKLPASTGNATTLEILNLGNCSKLEELPSSFENFINLKELDLIGCSSLVKLPASFGNVINLKKLHLKGCLKLEELPDSFGSAINIKELDLGGCSSLKELPGSFGNAINLEILNLSKCLNLVELPSSFGNFKNLKELNLSGCSSLVKLPFSFGNAVNLKKLFLRRCSSLVNLPASFGNAINFKTLYLDGCSSLKELPDPFGSSANLKELYLNGCSSLVKLPLSFGNDTNLEILCLRGCSNLIKLPASFGNATSLEILDLSDCSSLVDLPSSFGNFINLKELYLIGCSNLKKLPDSFGNVINLKKLFLTGCSSLLDLPASFGNAINLEKLYLDGCSSLKELPDSFGDAINLDMLDLSNCSSLVKLPFSFGNFVKLKKLYLIGCSSLVDLPDSFENAIKLKNLYMDGCSSLKELPESFGNATNLKILDLSDCSSLVELPDSFGNAINLKELYLTGCSSLKELPYSLGNAANLKKLYLMGCSSLVELPGSIGNATKLNILDLSKCSSLRELPSSIGNAINLQELNLEYCSSLEKLPSSFGNASLKKVCLTGCSRLVDFSFSIRDSTSRMSINFNEDKNQPIVTFSDKAGSKSIEVRCAKKGIIFVYKGERKSEHSVSLVLRIEDEKGRGKDTYFLFCQRDDTASKVSNEMAKKLGLPEQFVAFMAELIDILLVNLNTTWKTDVRVDQDSQLIQNTKRHHNKAKSQKLEETALLSPYDSDD